MSPLTQRGWSRFLLGNPSEDVDSAALRNIELAIVRHLAVAATAAGGVVLIFGATSQNAGVVVLGAALLAAGGYAIWQRAAGRAYAFDLMLIMVGLTGLLIVVQPRDVGESLESGLPIMAALAVLVLDARRAKRFVFIVAAVWLAAEIGEVAGDGWQSLGNTQDMTARVVLVFLFVFGVYAMTRAKEELISRESRYRTLFRESPVGLLIISKDGQMLEVNPAMVDMFGYPSEETFLATPVEAYWVRPEERFDLVRSLTEGPVESKEVELRRYDGSTIWARVAAASIHDADRIKLLITDVTEERSRRRALEYEAAAKDRFIATVSHALRTPLTGVLASVAELRDRLRGEEDSLSVELSNLALQQAEDLSLTVDNLLVVGRTDRRFSVAGNFEAVPLRGLVEGVLTPLGEGLRSVHVSGEETVWVDRYRTRQILRNLIDNVVKHGGDHTDITMHCEGPSVVLSVADNGPGVSSDQLPYIFKRYEADDPTPARSLGIGLFVSQTIAAAMGGSIRYRREGQITIFDLRLLARTGST